MKNIAEHKYCSYCPTCDLELRGPQLRLCPLCNDRLIMLQHLVVTDEKPAETIVGRNDSHASSAACAHHAAHRNHAVAAPEELVRFQPHQREPVSGAAKHDDGRCTALIPEFALPDIRTDDELPQRED